MLVQIPRTSPPGYVSSFCCSSFVRLHFPNCSLCRCSLCRHRLPGLGTKWIVGWPAPMVLVQRPKMFHHPAVSPTLSKSCGHLKASPRQFNVSTCCICTYFNVKLRFFVAIKCYHVLYSTISRCVLVQHSSNFYLYQECCSTRFCGSRLWRLLKARYDQVCR